MRDTLAPAFIAPTFMASAFLAFVMASGSAMAAAPSTCDANTQNQVQNCGFETGSFAGWMVSGSAAVIGQTNLYGVDALDPNTGTYAAYFGTQGATLGTHLATDSLSITQAIALTESLTYQLSFSLAQDTPTSSGYTNYFSVQWDGATIMQQTLSTAQGYTLYSYTVTGSASGGNTLSFLSQNDSGFWDLDDISLIELPEPSSLAAFGVGLAALGFTLRKRASRT
jgi:hypothetical protein